MQLELAAALEAISVLMNHQDVVKRDVATVVTDAANARGLIADLEAFVSAFGGTTQPAATQPATQAGVEHVGAGNEST